MFGFRSLLVVCVTAALLPAQISSAGTFWPKMPLGTAQSLAAENGTVVVGGEFSFVAKPTSSLVFADRATGALVAAPILDGTARGCVRDPLGGWFVYGSFNSINGVPRRGLARFFDNGLLDLAWDAPVVGSVECAVVVSGTLWIGGSFATVHGVFRDDLAAVDATNGTLLPFNPGTFFFPPNSFAPIGPGGVFRMREFAGVLYIAGRFEAVAGLPRDGFAAFDIGSGTLLPWAPSFGPTIIGFPFSVNTTANAGLLEVAGSKLFISNLNGTTLRSVDLVSGTFLGAAIALNGVPFASTASFTTLYLGGQIASVNGVPRDRLAAIDVATETLTPWAPSPNDGPIYSMSLEGPDVFVAGNFRQLGSISARGLARIDGTTGIVSNTGVSPVTSPSTIAASPTRMVITGELSGVGAVSRGGLAAFDVATGALLPLDIPINFTTQTPNIRSVAISDGVLYFSGSFDTVHGQPRNGVAAVDLLSGALLPFAPTQSFTYPPFLQPTPAGILAQASFAAFDLRLLDETTGSELWVSTFDSTLTDVLWTDEGVYVTGNFIVNVTGGLQLTPYIALLDLGTGLPLPLATTLDAQGYSLAAAGDDLYVSGLFSNVNGQARPKLAAISRSSGLPTAWIPNPALTYTPRQLEVLGATLLCFPFEGQGAPFALDRSTGQRLSWTPPASVDKAALVVSDRVLRGGAHALTAPVNGTMYPALLSHQISMTAATLTELGQGCGAGAPTLTGTLPILGETWTRIVQSAPLLSGSLWRSFTAPASPINLGNGCDLWLGLDTTVLVTTFVTDGLGRFVDNVTVPPILGLQGFVLREQAVLFPNGGFQLTNGLSATLGY